MITDALLAYFHFSAIFILFAFLTAEAMVLRNPLDGNAIRLISRIDIWYFASAMLVLASGLARLFWGAKGAAFYTANPMFHAKVGLFIVVAALSLPPTLQILRWARQARQDGGFAAPEAERARVRRLVMIELHVASLLPLFAVMMARGIGFSFSE